MWFTEALLQRRSALLALPSWGQQGASTARREVFEAQEYMRRGANVGKIYAAIQP